MLHLDVKPENILVHAESSGRVLYKLGDFGLARPWTCSSCSPQLRFRMGSSGGDGRYICPELLNSLGSIGNMHPAADIFSLGMSIYELVWCIVLCMCVDVVCVYVCAYMYLYVVFLSLSLSLFRPLVPSMIILVHIPPCTTTCVCDLRHTVYE
jgi:serine/threonine protein kinase